MSDKKAWYATKVTKRKYAGFAGVAGLARCVQVKLAKPLWVKPATHHIVLVQPIPDLEKELCKLLFRDRYAVDTYPLPDSDEMR